MIIITKNLEFGITQRNRRKSFLLKLSIFCLITAILSTFGMIHLNQDPLNERGSHSNSGVASVNDVSQPSRPAPKADAPAELTNATQKLNEPLDTNTHWKTVLVKSGDSLSLIFKKFKFDSTFYKKTLAIDRKTNTLPQLKPGQRINFVFIENKMLSMIIELSPFESIWFVREGEEVVYRREIIQPLIKVASTHVIIEKSLFFDAQKAGLSDTLIMKLAEIFGWDIDFSLDLRPGDSFTIIFEKVYKDKEFIKSGRILAAEFINRKKALRAAIFRSNSENDSYYTLEGHAMKKAFLRAPLKFSRISSRFNPRRRHPVLNTIRAHKGVDYAAPLGTPVRATADGKVKEKGNNGGYGKTVILAHGTKYSTLYAHLSRFNRKIKKGSYVSQGEIIGYVGKTGLATGPHLHYEFRVNNRYKDPLKVKFPPAQPLTGNSLKKFQNNTKLLFSHLNIVSKSRDRDKSIAHVNKHNKNQTKIN